MLYIVPSSTLSGILIQGLDMPPTFIPGAKALGPAGAVSRAVAVPVK